MIAAGAVAPELQVSEWLGEPTSLAALRGEVIALHAFQLLCPGCIYHGVPQAIRMHEALEGVTVLGLHSVFEHHEAMRVPTLRAFMHELRVAFPVGVDAHEEGSTTPKTMQAYGLRGTPSLVLIGRDGRVAEHWFGRPGDLEVGAALGALRSAPEEAAAERYETRESLGGCVSGVCEAPAHR